MKNKRNSWPNTYVYTVKHKIKNPDIRIITANIEYSPLDIREFRKQIPEMLEQKLIRRSESPHRTAAFIVRNHSEEKRGKPEALNFNFFIEPEEVKSFSQVASEKPSEIISAQAEVIKNLEKQVLDIQSQLFLSNSKVQELEKVLDSKNREVSQDKKKIFDLNSQNFSLKQKIQKLGIEEKTSFNLENLKARILDQPYTEALKPLFEKLPELDLTISTKALEGLIADLQ